MTERGWAFCHAVSRGMSRSSAGWVILRIRRTLTAGPGGGKSAKKSLGTGTTNPSRATVPNGWGVIMRTKVQRMALLGMLMGALLGTGLMAPASAAGTTQVGGDAEYDTACTRPPEGFDDYPGLRLTGSLEGCLYTVVTSGPRRPGAESRPVMRCSSGR